MRSFLQRYRYSKYNLSQSGECSRWLQLALQKWLYVRRFPAERLTFEAELQRTLTDSFQASVAASPNNSAHTKSNWEHLALLELIRQNSPSKNLSKLSYPHF